MLKKLLVFLFLMALTVSCSGAEQEAPAVEEENAGNNPTSETVAEISVAEGDFGRNEDGTYFRGSADAPVTLYDYSDFL